MKKNQVSVINAMGWTLLSELYMCDKKIYAWLQLRNSKQNGFHDNFLISGPNPMM